MVAPTATNQNPPWNNQRFLSIEVVAEFRTVMEKWPKNFWERVIVGMFKDSRTPLVEDLQNFWEAQYNDLWSRRLDAYLRVCITFMQQRQQALQTIVQKEIDEQERLNDPEVRKKREQEIKEVIAAFEAKDQERRQIQTDLAQALQII